MTPQFADNLLSREQVEFWCWYSAVCSRLVGRTAFSEVCWVPPNVAKPRHEKPGSKFECYKIGKKNFTARVTCQYCRNMLELLGENGNLLESHENALLHFFCLSP